jgi:hypothetical protein
MTGPEPLPPGDAAVTDPNARVHQTNDDFTNGADYVPAIVAQEVFDHLAEHHPDVLDDALWLSGPDTLRTWINARDHSRRGHAAQRARSSAFRDAADAHEGGDPTAMRRFLDSPYTVEGGVRRRLGKMRAPDLGYVAGAYEMRAASNALVAGFMRALEREVGDGTVEDRYTEDQVRAMWSSLTDE